MRLPLNSKRLKPRYRILGKLARFKALEHDITSNRKSILKNFAKGSYFQVNNRLTPGGRTLKDIAIIEKESLSSARQNVGALKRGSPNSMVNGTA